MARDDEFPPFTLTDEGLAHPAREAPVPAGI